MAGSSSGGGGISVDKRLKGDIRSAASGQQIYANKIGDIASQYGYLAGGQLTPAEMAQMQAIDVGDQAARQSAQQNVREQASARGLYSSAGAIGQEAATLGGFDIQRAQNIANVYGNAQQRQFQGIGTLGGLYGQASSLYGGAGQTLLGLSGQQLQASQYNSQLQQQQQQQQQNSLRQNVMGGAALIAAPFTGGASLGYFAGGR